MVKKTGPQISSLKFGNTDSNEFLEQSKNAYRFHR